jgi:hypothetical protein
VSAVKAHVAGYYWHSNITRMTQLSDNSKKTNKKHSYKTTSAKYKQQMPKMQKQYLKSIVNRSAFLRLIFHLHKLTAKSHTIFMLALDSSFLVQDTWDSLTRDD